MIENNNIAVASDKHINKYKIAHSVGVAEYMRERAEDYKLKPNEMYILGIMHDIGYLEGQQNHEQHGSELLRNIGMATFSLAVNLHGSKLRDIFTDYKLEYSLKADNDMIILLVEADLSVNSKGFRVGFDNRLQDILDRYGNKSKEYIIAKDNIQFIKEYWQYHKIKEPLKLNDK